jgi:glycosyltransferase involved in cell wall biosynthesis
LYQAWFEWAVPRKLKEVEADLFFSPEGYLSLSSSVPSVNVIHDINFLHHPEMLDRAHRWHFNRYFPRYAEKAKHVITVSEYSKQDILEHYKISDEKISVVYNGVSDAFLPVNEIEKARVRSEKSNGVPYFVFVGSLHPRKNITRLIKAFDLFKTKTGHPHKLLIVGKRAFLNKEMDEAYESIAHKTDVMFTGRLEEQEMIETVASAQAMTFLPLFEGFGMPIIEAFSCGVPVIASNISALPEIAGDTAILVDPLNIEAIADAMSIIAQDKLRRDALGLAGMERAQAFDWNYTAKQIAGIIQKHLG